MFHCLDVLRVNGYILYKQTSLNHPDIDDKKILDHKTFTKELINSLTARAHEAKQVERETRRNNGEAIDDDEPFVPRPKLSNTNPKLDIYNEWRSTCKQTQVAPVKTQNECKYCKYLQLLDKKAGKEKKDWKYVHKRYRWCSHCKVWLCPGECFLSISKIISQLVIFLSLFLLKKEGIEGLEINLFEGFEGFEEFE